MNLRATLYYLKKKDAASVVVAIVLALSLINIVQAGGTVGMQLASLVFESVDGTWSSLGSYFGRSYVQQLVTNIFVAVTMVATLELLLRAWLWYKGKQS